MIRLRLAALALPVALATAACDAPPAPADAAPDASAATSAAPPEPPASSAAPPVTPPASAPAAPEDAGALAAADAGGASGASGAMTERDAGALAATDAGQQPPKDAGGASGASGTTTERDAGGAGAPTDAGGGPAASATGAGAVPPAEAGSAEAIAAEVDTIFVGKKTYFARFKQEHTQKISGAVKKQSGTISVEKPDKISFRYDPPSQNRIVSDGVSLKVYVAEDRQMFVTPVQNSEYPGALSFLMGHGLRPSFTFTFNEKAKFEGGPVLVGKPRTPTPHYDLVMFYIDKALLAKKDPGVVRRVLIVDAQGNRNRFDFENASQPASIEPAEFQFTAPPGTDVKQN
ncbi:outer membrane lipoprotein carrier protein LolA [Sorangium sp. So ce136]|uniref:LolA family protein n=1 Tax=Sorangium sp. So ce136 TaxID=3133284 RepID=UPI003F0EFBCE